MCRIQINNIPEADELWSGIGGHFDSLGQIINEFLDNSISNFVGNNVEIRNIRVTLEELDGGKVKVSIEDTGTGILDLDHAFKLGSKRAGESPLNEHGFGLKHAMASANPTNDSWVICTRTAQDVHQNQFKKIGAPYKINDYEAEICNSDQWPGSLGGISGTVCQFTCEKDMFNTLSRGLRGGMTSFRSLADVLFEDIGFTYSGILSSGQANISLRLVFLNGSTLTKPIGAVEPNWEGFIKPGSGTEQVNLGGGILTLEYKFGRMADKDERQEFNNSTARKYYRKRMSSSGVEIRINGRVLCHNLFYEVWGKEKHNSYNYLLVSINLVSNDKDTLPTTRTSKNGLREGDPKFENLLEWIRARLHEPVKDVSLSDHETDLFEELKRRKEQYNPDPNKVIDNEMRVFTSTGDSRDKVRIDLYELTMGRITIYEGKKDVTSSKDVYQLRMYWDGLVFDGITPDQGILIANSHPDSVQTLIRIVNSMQDANGNNYNFISKTWQDEGMSI